MKNMKAFTLMELMIVIAIIMVLSGAIVARIGTGSEKAKIAKAKAEIEEIASACRAFNMDTGYWPQYTNPTALDPGLIDKDKINQLIYENGFPSQAPRADAFDKWKGPYLDAATWPKDPWGTQNYWVVGATYSDPYRVLVVCAGPDKKFEIYNDNADDLKVLVHIFSNS